MLNQPVDAAAASHPDATSHPDTHSEAMSALQSEYLCLGPTDISYSSAPPNDTMNAKDPIGQLSFSFANITGSGHEPSVKPGSLDSKATVLPNVLIDSATGLALAKIDNSGIDAKIPSGGGPYQALRQHFNELEISNQDLSKASAFIRDNRMSGHTLKTGETVPTGESFEMQDLMALNSAKLRESLHLRPDAPEAEVDKVLKADNIARLRESLHLKPDAPEAEVDKVLMADDSAKLRESLHLRPDATEAEVEKALRHIQGQL